MDWLAFGLESSRPRQPLSDGSGWLWMASVGASLASQHSWSGHYNTALRPFCVGFCSMVPFDATQRGEKLGFWATLGPCTLGECEPARWGGSVGPKCGHLQLGDIVLVLEIRIRLWVSAPPSKDTLTLFPL